MKSKKERTEKQTKMERALEGVVCGFQENTADDTILKKKNGPGEYQWMKKKR